MLIIYFMNNIKYNVECYLVEWYIWIYYFFMYLNYDIWMIFLVIMWHISNYGSLVAISIY